MSFRVVLKQRIGRCGLLKSLHRLFLFALILSMSSSVYAQSFTGVIERPVVSIVIDDLGDTYETGLALVELPAALTYSFLPHTPYSVELAERAARLQKEVMLHMPMEPSNDERMGPGGLTIQMTESEFVAMVKANLAAIPHAIGVNNHMGSLLTSKEIPMRWLMRELANLGDYYFVDSMTSRKSVAAQIATEMRIPNIRREIFLDHERTPDRIRLYFDELIERAWSEGSAVAIAHPHPMTIRFLKENLPRLAESGVLLVPVSQLIDIHNRRNNTWRVSWSPSLKAAKN